MMLKICTAWVAAVFLAGILSSAAESRYEYYRPLYENPESRRSGRVHDIIGIHQIENELIGIVEGRREYSVVLDRDERIVWRGSKGEVGAVLTENRALALTRVSRGWVELELRSRESGRQESITPFISDYLVMMVTGRRIIGFDSRDGRWVQKSVPLHDRIIDSHINSYVAAVITNKRVFAWAWGRSDFRGKKLRRDETIQYVDTQPHTVTIGTDRRVLVFKSGGGGWREF
ncbi:MAG: hypothetical protein ACOC8R_02420 [Desulfosalsimonas sp.]